MWHLLKRIYAVDKSTEFNRWFEQQSFKSRTQIDERLFKIMEEGYFGERKQLNDHVWELKWKNGRRVYYAYIAELNIILLLGGNKNGQNKDIAQAKKILGKYKSC